MAFVAALLAGEVTVAAPVIVRAAPQAVATRPSVPAGEAQEVPALVSERAPVAKPGEVPVGVAPEGYDAKRSVELPDQRGVYDTVYANADGSHTVTKASTPVHFKTADGWQAIDSTLVQTADGAWVNRANSWTISFPNHLSGVIGFSDDRGSFGWTAVGAAPVKAVVEADGATIRYPDAWPNADLVYVVTSVGVEEKVVVKNARASSSYWFEVVDAVIVEGEDGSLLAKAGALEVALGEPMAMDAADVPVAPEASVDLKVSAGERGSLLELSVSGGWLRGQKASAFPITIDPTLVPAMLTSLSYPKPGQGYPTQAGLRTGNPAIVSKPAMIWRSIAAWDYWTGNSNLLGKRVTNATVTLTTTGGGGSGVQGIKAYWADVNGFHDTQTPRALPPPYPYGYSWAAYHGSGSLNGIGSTTTMDLTALYDFWTSTVPQPWGTLLFKGDNEPTNGTNTLKQFTAVLSITWDDPPSAPALTGSVNPADGSRWWAMPTYLEATQSTNLETSETLNYRVEFGTDAAFTSGVLMSSNWASYATFPPVGALFLAGAIDRTVLDPGQTYYWRIAVTDGWYVVPSTSSRSFVWDPDPINAPTHDVGPFSVNAASGTSTTSVGTPGFQTVGGAISSAFSYSSSTEPAYGVTLSVVKDANANGVADADERVVVSNRTGTIDSNWGASGPTADTSDYFVAEWNGYVTAASAGWQLGLECDGKAKVWVNGSLVLDKMSSTICSAPTTVGAIDWAAGTLPTTPQTIKVQLVESTGNAFATVWIRQGNGTATRIPSSWLTTRKQTLPVGWQFSSGPATMDFVRAEVDGDTLSLLSPDGSSTDWSRAVGSTSTQGWRPETGGDGVASQGTNGVITVTTGGLTYTFNADGTLRQAVTAIDDKNRSSAAIYAYDASGRPTKVSDPVTGRQLRMIYQGQAGCGTAVIPTGYLCAVQFAMSDSDVSPETFTALGYSSSDPWATLATITNYPDPANPTALDKNETWQFGYAGGYGATSGRLSSLRDPSAYDAIRSGAWTGATADTLWDMTFAGTDPIMGYYWSWPTAITAPAPTVGAPRPQTTIQNVPSYNHTGFTDIKSNVTGTSPPAGYVTRYLLDSTARAISTFDAAGRQSSIVWDSNDRVTSTTDTLGRKTKTYYDTSGNALEQWGPIPATNAACWTDLVARTNPSSAFPVACDDVPVVETDYDLDTITNAEYTGLDVTWWANTNIGPSGAETKPALNTLGVGTSDGSLNVNWGTSGPTGLKNAAGTTVTDNFSGEFTGVIVFPTSGTYTMKLDSDDYGSLWIDGIQLVQDSSYGVPKTGTFTATAGTRYKIRLTLIEFGGGAKVTLSWTPPAGAEVVVPGSALHPDYGFATRSRTYTSAGAVADVQTFKLQTPQYGQVEESTANTSTTEFAYEPSGTGWGRTISRTLPAGNGSTYVYYGDTATLTAATCGVAAGTVQSGLMRQRLGSDPDGAGSQKRRIEEFLYDRYGNQRGSRVGVEGATANELDATVPWACTATVDGRQRPLTQTFPASASDPARTVWFDYAKNGNPLVAEVCDDNVTGSPTASSDTCNGKNGVITSTVDMLGRTTAYTDVWSKTTTTGYNQAGQVTQRVSPSGTETFDYTSEGQLWKHNLGGIALATLTYNANGELKTVSYLNGTSLADLDVAGRRFDDRSIQELVFTGPDGTITANKITLRDRDGRVTRETIDGKEYRYSYDNYDRLVDTQFGSTGFMTPDDVWQYCFQDLAGTGGAATGCTTAADVSLAGKNSNRVSAFHNSVKTAGYTYDDADRLTSVSLQAPYAGNTITYDDRGNTTAIGGETLTYDGADRHMSTTGGATTVVYQRDALDRVVSRVAPDGTTRYTYGAGGDTSSAVLDGSSTLTQATVSLAGGVLLTRTGGTDTWSYPNIQGSVVAVADSAGFKLGGTFFYDPFGNSLTPGNLPDNSAGSMDYGYLGQFQRPVEHAAGLRQQTEMGARGYDATLGRFLEVDPVEGGVDNDYGYVSDPEGGSDPTGEASEYRCRPKDKASRVLVTYVFQLLRGIRRPVKLECGDGSYGLRHILASTPRVGSHFGGHYGRNADSIVGWTLACTNPWSDGKSYSGRDVRTVESAWTYVSVTDQVVKNFLATVVIWMRPESRGGWTILTAYPKGKYSYRNMEKSIPFIASAPSGCQL